MTTVVELGKKYRDSITGFEGIAVARHEYLNGCVRITLQPTQLKDGKTIESETFDKEQMVLVDDGVLRSARAAGGPGAVPPPRTIPHHRA